jgi:uncharacterized protein YaiE (UPF0345 family)
MTSSVPSQIDNVSAVCKANVYFDGGVISHTLLMKDGKKKTLGIIRPGSYRFNTDAAETMEIVAGQCRVRHAGDETWTGYAAGSSFKVPAKSSFEIAADAGLGGDGFVHYICSFE